MDNDWYFTRPRPAPSNYFEFSFSLSIFFYSSFFTKILILAVRFSVEVKSIRARRSLESFLSLNFEVKLQVLDCQL